MQDRIIEAFNERYNCHYKDFEEIRKEFSVAEILDTWLNYEGIFGFTREIIDALGECGVYIEE